ncbi:MAG: mismatch repair protein MutL [Haloplasmataceae bacterium]|jgi:uncharacterized protein (TIGR01319 family)|nr:mismatch repair protein MutL [Haloplasmataceae bacterium]
MKIDVLVLEIGSTTTIVNAFTGIHNNKPILLGQGNASTTVSLGDVNIGILEAIENLKFNLDIKELEAKETFASSSAAGGLKMTVHGLVYDMTVKAAKEAALGAGANIHLITAGKITQNDIKKLQKIKPNIILISGGVDYGEKATVIYNAELIAKLKLNIPVIYAGNCESIEEIKTIFCDHEQNQFLHLTDNVYPKIDVFNVEPTRKIIQEVFEEHIIHTPGMEKVKAIVYQNIVPTPGACMLAAKLLANEIGDLVVIDVGGATTDVHSVTNGSEEISKILISPEPLAKRTVEGDLGVYVNRQNIIDLIGTDQLAYELNLSLDELTYILDHYQVIPSGKQIKLVERLTSEATIKALIRHCGKYRSLYGTKGKVLVAEGKDLTGIKFVIGTGGALTRLPNRINLLKEAFNHFDSSILMPRKYIEILIDEDYIMASLGVLSLKYPIQALTLLKSSLGIRE